MQRTSPIGEVIIELAEIDSTNNYAMRLISEGMADHGMVIQADFQTQGKGQHGHIWMAEESKNLLCSMILDAHPYELQQQFRLNMLACLALANYLIEHAGMEHIRIKWPNDIYAGSRKMAGILIENSLRGHTWTHAIIGIGLNVNQTHFPEQFMATSMQLETRKTYKINQVLKGVIRYFDQMVKQYPKLSDSLIQHYNELLYGIHEPILYKKGNEMYEGILSGVDASGHLSIHVNGKFKTFKHRDIELIPG